MRKQRSKERYASWLALVDFLFNYAIAFAFLFIAAFFMIRPQATNDANVKAKAEFIMTMTWPDESLDDIDLWLMLPNGEKIWYRHKDGEAATLDRDDLGGNGDTYRLNPVDPADQRMGLVKSNREVITVRAIVPGKYILAAHAFAARPYVGEFKNPVPFPYKAKLEVLKVNPRVQVISNTEVTLERVAQQATFVSFIVLPDGSVTDVVLNPDDQIVELTEKQ